ncbi:hypothetical protein HHI36_005643 [Cryptolaemus montrouzieri]|uniref:Uncharacterized protein n=1 Tax=Cryptolaemus montrouzieri TaxID=559131 RepID=A0ABD2NVD4_9CUCU
MCDLEKELVIYFFNVIMETNFIGQYQIPVEEPICVEKFVSPLIDNLNENSEQQPESKVSFIDTTMFQQRPLKDSSSESLLMTFVYQKEKLRSIARRKSDTNGSTGRKTSGGNGKSARKESTLGKRKSNQTDASRKDLVAHERRRSQGNPLQPITEDNLVDSAIEKNNVQKRKCIRGGCS